MTTRQSQRITSRKGRGNKRQRYRFHAIHLANSLPRPGVSRVRL